MFSKRIMKRGGFIGILIVMLITGVTIVAGATILSSKSMMSFLDDPSGSGAHSLQLKSIIPITLTPAPDEWNNSMMYMAGELTPAEQVDYGYMLATDPPPDCPVDITGDALWPYGSHTNNQLSPADSTGTVDTTAALQKLMDCAYESRLALILPDGSYLISDTLRFFQNEVARRATDFGGLLIGSTRGSRPKIILSANSPGFGDATHTGAKPILKFTGGERIPTGQNDPCAPYCETLFPSNTFHMGLKNVDIVVRPGNPGAIGINMPAAQQCFIEDVTMDLTAGGFAGMDAVPGIGGYFSNIEIAGGLYGYFGETEVFPDPYMQSADPSVTAYYNRGKQGWPIFTNIILRDQTQAAVYKPTGVVSSPFMLVGFEIIKDTAPAIVVADRNGGAPVPATGDRSGGSSIGLVDGSIRIRTPSDIAVIDNTPGKIVTLNNVYLENATTVITSHTKAPVTGGNGWIRVHEYIAPRPDAAAAGPPRGKIIDGTILADDNEIITVTNPSFPPSAALRTQHGTIPEKSADHSIFLSTDPATTKICNAKNPSDIYEITGDMETNPTPHNDLPGLQAMVDDPNCETVFLPKGDYFVAPTEPNANGLLLKSHTKLIGIGGFLSRLRASRAPTRATPEGWLPTSQVWIIDTPDDVAGTAQITQIGVMYPTGDVTHDWFGTLRWRIGKAGQIKSIEPMPAPPATGSSIDQNPRVHLFVTGNGGGKWYGLNSIKARTLAGRVDARSRRFLAENTTGQPLLLYGYNIEEGNQYYTDITDGWASEFHNVRNITIYNSKYENPQTTLFHNVRNVAYFGGGAAEIEVRSTDDPATTAIEQSDALMFSNLTLKGYTAGDRDILQERVNGTLLYQLDITQPLAIYKKGTVDREAMRIGANDEVTPTATPMPTGTVTPTPARVETGYKVRIISPNGGEQMPEGQPMEIQWQFTQTAPPPSPTPPFDTHIRLFYTRTDGTINSRPIVHNNPNSSWEDTVLGKNTFNSTATIPPDANPAAGFKIAVYVYPPAGYTGPLRYSGFLDARISKNIFFIGAGGPTATPTHTPGPLTPTVTHSPTPTGILPPTVTLTPTVPPTATQTPTPTTAPVGKEKVVFNDQVQFTAADRGFHTIKSEGQNIPGLPINWKSPDDYYTGTWYFRYIITEHPTNTPGKLQVCIWNMPGHHPENCAPQVSHSSTNTPYTASRSPATWYQKGGVPLDFTSQTPFQIRAVLRGADGCSVTNYSGVPGACWNQWPNFQDMKFKLTVIMVPAGQVFSGWQNYP